MANGFNRFETYIPSQFNLPKVDLGILAGVLDAKQKRFDTGYELADKLGQAAIDALPQDRARANTILAEWDKKKNDIVNNYDGDYASAYRELNMLRQDIEKQLKPGGEANAMIANKAAFSDWYSRMSKDKEVNPESLNLAYNYYMNPESKGYYSGVGEKNPLTQSYNVFSPEEIIAYTNPDTVVLPAIKQLEASGFEKEWDSVGGQWIMRNKQSGETLTEEEIARTAFRSLANDKNYFNALSQVAKFRGEDNYDPTEYAMGLARDYGRDYAYSKTKKSQTISPNEWAMTKYKADRDDARQGQLLSGMSETSTQRGTLDYSQNALGKDVSIQSLGLGKWESTQLPGYIPGVGGRTTLYRPQNSSEDTLRKEFISKLNNGELANTNISLMKAVVNNNPKGSVAEYVAEYNKQKKNIGAALMSATDVFSNEAGESFAQQLLMSPVGQYTTISVSSPGQKPSEITYEEFLKRYKQEIYDDKGKLNDRFKTLSVKTDGSDGYTPGFVMKMQDGTTVKMSAPPAYVTAKRPVMDLTQAYYNTSGEGITEGVPGFNLPYFDPQTKQVYNQDWSESRMKMKVTYRKNQYGNLEPEKKLYEYVQAPGAPEGEWKPAKFKYNTSDGRVVEEDLDIDLINRQLNDQALKANFSTIQQTAKNTFMEDSFGNKIRVQ